MHVRRTSCFYHWNLDLFSPFTLTHLCDMICLLLQISLLIFGPTLTHSIISQACDTLQQIDPGWVSITWSSHLNWSVELAVFHSFSMLTEQWPWNISFFCATERLTSLYLLVSNSLTELYGIRVQPMPPFRSLSCKPDPALIHHCLPDELLLEVMVIWTEEYLFSFS